jgi:protocatechuate 3,4-dioxygenase beta subunit
MTDLDDTQVGRVLSRREVLTLFGAAGTAAVLAGCAPGAASSASPATRSVSAAAATAVTTLPSCIVRPAETEGPYFVDERLLRSDIRSDPADGSVRPGVPIALTFVVSQIAGGTCSGFADLLVDVWQCDALGVYSDVSDPGFQTTGSKFLRGYQVTDAAGRVTFTTVYPGWYQGRTVHIHFKIRSDAGATKALEFTSQLFFDDTVTDTVHALQPYAQKGRRTLRNDGDGIYATGGDQLLLALDGDPSTGYTTTFEVGLQLT